MKFYDLSINNEVHSCRECKFYDVEYQTHPVEYCTHDNLYTEDGDLIEKANDEIIECMANPKHCALFVRK